MNKNVVKINESTLRQTVAKSVKKVLKEYTYGIEDERIPDDGDFCGSEQYRDFGDNPFCGKQPRFPSQVTKLIRIGKDMHGRPVFQGADSDFLFCDVNLGKGEPKYCTKLYNKFEGEPDLDMPDDWKPIVVDGATLNESQLRKIVAESVKKVLHESIKGTDPNNAVSKEIAEKFGFKPEYTGFDNGLELWGKRLNFNPLEDYAQASELLRQLGIRRFTSENYKGYVRITVCANTTNQKDKETVDKVAELIDFLDANKRGYHIEENASIEELRELLVNWLNKYCPWATESEMNSAIGG